MKKLFKVNEDYVDEATFERTLEEICQEEAENGIDELIDSCTPEIEVLSYTFSPSKVLKECDEQAYRCEICNLADSLQQNTLFDLERGEVITLAGNTFEIEETYDEN